MKLRIPIGLLAGNHGAEGPWLTTAARQKMFRTCRRWLARFDARGFIGCAGVEPEDKGISIAFHYRNAPGDRARLGRRLLRAARAVRPRARVIPGKFVVNLVPAGAPDKGRALLRFLRLSKTVTALYAGDDETDEDVFRLARGARRGRFFTIRIGRHAGSGAQWFLRSQAEIDRLLSWLTLARRHCGKSQKRG